MDPIYTAGRWIFGIAIAAFGGLSLCYRSGVRGLEPIPADWPGQLPAAIVTGFALLAVGIGIATGWRGSTFARALTMILGVWLLVLHLPLLISRPADPSVITIVSETLALFGAAWLLWAPSGKPAAAARACFGLPMFAFGILHLVYHEFVASLVPAWIPGRPAWAYITGVAFIAAGASITFRVLARPAAILLGVMFGSWAAIVHAPRVAANLGSQDEWTSLVIALAMCGASWLAAHRVEIAEGAGAVRHLPLVLLALLAPPTASAQVAAADSAELVGTTQRLLDAITDGDSAVWAPHLSPRWIMTDEEGRHITRGEFLKELRGLPEGQSGRLEIGARHLAGAPGVAVLSYDIEEWHDFYGQELRTRFHATDTWIRESRGWKLLATQVIALPTPIAGKAVSRRELEGYAGRYVLTPEIDLRIEVGDSGLSMVRRSRAAERLYAIDERIFVRHGVRGFWLFEREESGKVSALVNWRDNNPVRWKRAGLR